MSVSMRDLPDLHAYIRKGYFHELRVLVDKRSDVNVQDREGRTPLIVCTFLEDESWAVGIARMLLEKGAMVGHADRQGLNALSYACLYEREELVDVYLNAIDYDLNQVDKAGNTALMHAVSTGNFNNVRMLVKILKRYKLTVDRPNRRGMTPLLEACRMGHFECAKVLINDGGANEEHRDKVEKRNAKEWEEYYLVVTHQCREAWAEPDKNGTTTRPPGLPPLDLSGLKAVRSPGTVSHGSNSSSCDSSVSVNFEINDAKQRRPRTVPDTLQQPLRNELTIRPYSACQRERITVKFNPSMILYGQNVENSKDVKNSHGTRNRQNRQRRRKKTKDQNAWKRELGTIYKNYEIQVSRSYRHRALPKAPEVIVQVPKIGRGHKGLATVSEERECQSSSRSGRRSSMVVRGSSKEDVRKNDGNLNSPRSVKSGSDPNERGIKILLGALRRNSLARSNETTVTTEGAAKLMVNAFRRRRSRAASASTPLQESSNDGAKARTKSESDAHEKSGLLTSVLNKNQTRPRNPSISSSLTNATIPEETENASSTGNVQIGLGMNKDDVMRLRKLAKTGRNASVGSDSEY